MENRSGFRINDIFPILLFLAFTLAALGTVMVSVQIYQKILRQSDGSYDMETAVAYVTEKFRGHDENGSIEASSFMGHDAIMMTNKVLDETYVTYIYACDGYLRELYVAESELPSCNADSGNKILEMSDFSVIQSSESLIKLVFKDMSGSTMDTYLSVMSRKGDPDAL